MFSIPSEASGAVFLGAQGQAVTAKCKKVKRWGKHEAELFVSLSEQDRIPTIVASAHRFTRQLANQAHGFFR